MRIRFSCSKCGRGLEAASEDGGARTLCPECHTSLQVPPRALGPGITVGGFEIRELLGEGGMGTVYLARQLSMERDVALKILPPQFTMHPESVERFLHEVHMAARLEHPHIVTAYEAGEDQGVYFLAMACDAAKH